MTFLKFVTDRKTAYALRLAAILASVLFLMAFRVERQAIVSVTVIDLMAVIFIDLWEFFRKKTFYDRLRQNLKDLDQTYLLPEMLPQPSFYEGEILTEALFESDKSMCEHVAEYRRQSREFREYIELWVHEVKLPVAALSLMCHNNPETGAKMTAQLKRIDDDIENVLFYARCENAEKDYRIKEVSLQKAFGSAALKNRELLQSADASIETSGLKVDVLTDGKWLSFIFGQLMANSLKYRSPDRPLVLSVSATEQEGRVCLRFRDNGMGIPQKDLPYIFEKSFTGQNGRITGKSTGMGLYIVKNLCERLGHGIEARSEEGEYTEVLITFAKDEQILRVTKL